ncbi:hypothetical protein [Alistipes sp.]|uniref:hypothetical protein n=1 Tax=Alistipes sp. TaxID=1872444 RepID=UPI003AEF4FAD
MKKFLLLVLALGVTQLGSANKQKKADAETDKFRYDIEYARPSGDGVCQVKVWSYSKKSRIAAEQCRKNAVHGIIFKSYSTGDGTTASQRPLVKDPSVQRDKAEFFEDFFSDGGPYRQFVSAVTDGSQEVVKVGKQYKVGVVVTVSKDQLRKYLESEGIIRSLASGF